MREFICRSIMKAGILRFFRYFDPTGLNSGKTLWVSLTGVSIISLILSLIISCEKPAVNSGQGAEGKRWFRGNTHTHTMFLDYFQSKKIKVIASWYKDAGYDFLVLTDHNTHDGDRKIICHDEASDPPGFIMLCGLELSRTTHITALGIDRYIGDERSLKDGTELVNEAGGVAILNHPMFPPVTASGFLSAKGLNHIEIFNGKRPKDTFKSEILWDSLLSASGGRPVFAVAADDNHHRKIKTGRGWIMVEAQSLTSENIEKSIRNGNFYASTGVFLKDYKADKNEIRIETENGTKVAFIGRYGTVLSTTEGTGGVYRPAGNEFYIRIKVTGEEGIAAWTQPVFLK